MFCICHCPAIACDFPLILRNGSVLSSCLTVTLLLQCHFYWNLLCSNQYCLSPFLPLSPPLSRWQTPPCPEDVVSTAAAHSLGLEPSVCELYQQQHRHCFSFLLTWKEPFSDARLSGGALSHKHHLRQQDTVFLSITVHVPANVEMTRETSSEGNYESSIHRPMWPIRVWI